MIRAINDDLHPKAKIVAVDIPSAGANSCADVTVTFAAPKIEMLLGEDASNCGRIVVGDIGIADELLKSDLAISAERTIFAELALPRQGRIPIKATSGMCC